MGRQLVTACMFCLLCATHAHCSSHQDIHNSHVAGIKTSYSDEDFETSTLQQLTTSLKRLKRDEERSPDDFVALVFNKFGDGKTINVDGFQELLYTLGLSPHKDHIKKKEDPEDLGCVDAKSLAHSSNGVIEKERYMDLCPLLIYHMIPPWDSCRPRTLHEMYHEHNRTVLEETSEQSAIVWVYASLSVLMISLCGLLAVAVIPLMQKAIYHGLLQFLVALAIGTLCGDALLHLLPHAMMPAHVHHEEEEVEWNEVDVHTTNLWRGFAAVLSVVFFYFLEKSLSILAEWRKHHQRKTRSAGRVRVMREENGRMDEGRVGEKLCKHKYSSYPYCYGEITNSSHNNHVTAEGDVLPSVKVDEVLTQRANNIDDLDPQKEDVPSSEKQLLEASSDANNDYTTTIIIREHETRHHGHAHTHGHVHSPPGSLSSVAWMVVMGDGIHNFTDGLAIGAAFAANIGGGISTAVAVFCHELPHEIGDFAVLLKAGMSAKQAVFYNMLSSVLCLLGMCLGVILGHNESTKLWVFSCAAGMFLYIALVDMVPELTTSHSKEGGSICQCLLQISGMLTGVGIMLLIALYEHDLKEAFRTL